MTFATAATAERSGAVEWRRRRSEITHDWMRNRFLPSVHALLAVAGGEVVMSGAMKAELLAAVHEWPLRGAAALELIDGYGDALIESLPPQLPPGIRRQAFDAWMQRNAIPELLESSRIALRDADQSYSRWSNESFGTEAAAIVLPAMAAACERLLRVLCALPSCIAP